MAHSHEQSLLARLGFADPDRKDKRHTLACQYLCEPDVARKVLQVAGLDVTPKDAPPVLRVEFERKAPPDPPKLKPVGPPPKLDYDDDIMFGDAPGDEIDKKYPLIGELEERLIELRYGGTWYLPPSEAELKSRIRTVMWVGLGSYEMESRLSKRGGFLVGFADVILNYSAEYYQDEMESISKTERAYCLYYNDQRARIEEFQDKFAVDFRPVKHGIHSYGSILIEVKSQPVDVADILKQIAVYRDCRSFNKVAAATCYRMSATDKATLKAAGIHHIYLGDGFKAYCAKRAQEKPVEEEGI